MKILLLGSGGREHTLAWKIAQSPLVEELLIMPGNPGTSMVGKNIDGNPLDFTRVKEVVKQTGVKMVVVGPEDPLVNGIHDFFLKDSELQNVNVIGPTTAGAKLEGSKAFAKAFMERNNIPTAAYRAFSDGDEEGACRFLETLKPPYVLKADGLAAGKGVVIHSEIQAAFDDIHSIMVHGRFGKAGNTLVIEEYLHGIEVSVFVLTDGTNYLILPEAKDYKRIGEGDTGPNTGGMGSVSPVPFYNLALMSKVEEQIIKRTIRGLQKDGIPYSGFIFFGLMIVERDPYVIEYNVRMGDPETESVLPRVENDLVELLLSVADKTLHKHSIKVSSKHSATVMLVSSGYPGDYGKGYLIKMGDSHEGTQVFHAGTRQSNEGLVTNGGRVIAVTTLADSLESALERSKDIAEEITFEGKYFRRDLGKDLLSNFKE